MSHSRPWREQAVFFLLFQKTKQTQFAIELSWSIFWSTTLKIALTMFILPVLRLYHFKQKGNDIKYTIIMIGKVQICQINKNKVKNRVPIFQSPVLFYHSTSISSMSGTCSNSKDSMSSDQQRGLRSNKTHATSCEICIILFIWLL